MPSCSSRNSSINPHTYITKKTHKKWRHQTHQISHLPIYPAKALQKAPNRNDKDVIPAIAGPGIPLLWERKRYIYTIYDIFVFYVLTFMCFKDIFVFYDIFQFLSNFVSTFMCFYQILCRHLCIYTFSLFCYIYIFMNLYHTTNRAMPTMTEIIPIIRYWTRRKAFVPSLIAVTTFCNFSSPVSCFRSDVMSQ